MMTERSDAEEDEELKRHGITRVPADIFLWGGFRCSTARDALTAARRDLR
jgi:hypothetical protein